MFKGIPGDVIKAIKIVSDKILTVDWIADFGISSGFSFLLEKGLEKWQQQRERKKLAQAIKIETHNFASHTN